MEMRLPGRPVRFADGRCVSSLAQIVVQLDTPRSRGTVVGNQLVDPCNLNQPLIHLASVGRRQNRVWIELPTQACQRLMRSAQLVFQRQQAVQFLLVFVQRLQLALPQFVWAHALSLTGERQ